MRRTFPVLLLAGALSAQVPDGHYVVSSMWQNVTLQRPGGLFLVNPRIPGAPTAVQGLGPGLVGNPTSAVAGAGAVAIRQDDGVLIAGEIAGFGAPVHLHEIVLSGFTVSVDQRIQVGVAGIASRPGIAEIALMPDGAALIAVVGLVNGPPLHGAMLAIVDRQGGVTPVPIPAVSGDIPLALAIDPAGSTAYLVVAPVQSHSVNLYAVPLPAGGSAQLVATYQPIITGLTFDGGGQLIAASDFGLFRIDLPSGALTALTTLSALPANLDHEAATGGFAVVLNSTFGAASAVDHLNATLTPQTLTTSVPGILTDIAILHNPRSYGTGTPGTATYQWQTTPAPGGLPRAGNPFFGLQVNAQGGSPGLGAVVASFGTGNTVLFGVDVLLDQASAFPLALLPGNGMLPLPLPGTAPIGLTFFVQSFHIDAGGPAGIASTPGQRIQILP